MFSDTQLCPTLCDPMNCSLPGSSVQGISQVRTLMWVAISSSRGCSWPRDQTHVSGLLHWQADFLSVSHLGSRSIMVIKFPHALVWSWPCLHFWVTDLACLSALNIFPLSVGLQGLCWKLCSSIKIPWIWFSLAAFTVLTLIFERLIIMCLSEDLFGCYLCASFT